MCTPNNPTGTRIAESELRRLLRLGLPTVIDEAYYELGSGGSYAHLLSEFPNAMVLRTFSKAFGLAGLRLGYALGHESVIRLLGRVKVPWSVPAITLAAGMAALEDLSEQQARLDELCAGRSWLVDRISELPGMIGVPTEGNFVLIDVPRLRSTRTSSCPPCWRKAC